MSQKLNGGGQEQALQVPDLHFKICNSRPKPGLNIGTELLGEGTSSRGLLTTNEQRTGKWMRAARKGLKMSCIHPLGHHNWTRIIFGKPWA